MTATSSSTANERAQQIEQICLRLLARREHSRRELLDKLALRGFKRDEADPVIALIAEQNWQSESRFAESFIRQRIAQGYGPMRIQYDLQQRGIKGADLDEHAEQEGGWLALALAAYQRKYDDAARLSAGEWQKRSRFLIQRGYSGETIKRVFVELNIKLAS